MHLVAEQLRAVGVAAAAHGAVASSIPGGTTATGSCHRGLGVGGRDEEWVGINAHLMKG